MKNGDQPVFPTSLENDEMPLHPNDPKVFIAYPGLTKREYFAGQAMGAILAGVWSDEKMLVAFEKAAKSDGKEHSEYVATKAFFFADAMLSEGE